MTARERLDALLDPESFLEIQMSAGHGVDMAGDGLVGGSVTIGGRPVYVYIQDRTVRGGSMGVAHG